MVSRLVGSRSLDRTGRLTSSFACAPIHERKRTSARPSFPVCKQIRASTRASRTRCGSIAPVDVWEHEGRNFEVVMASDMTRDGMGLELTELGSSETGPVLEVIWHDDGGGFEFIAHHAVSLPLAVVERFVNHARSSLPPTDES